MRRHGLQAPLDPHQVASWIMFLGLVSGVYAFYVPFVEDAGPRWFLAAIYSILVVAIVSLGLHTSYLDPSDPGLSGATDGEYFCGLCQASVARNSKHCRACDRCVEGFDHHCKWLNNCIGTRNYWYFFGLISSTVSLLVLQLAWGLWLFIRSFRDRAEMRRLVADKYGTSVAYHGWQAALAAYMALLVTAVVMLGELFCFHVILINKGMSTYDYIVAQRDAKLAAPPPRGAPTLTGCRSGRVADATTARRKIKVGINPCALIKTRKPPTGTNHWDAAGGKPGLGSGRTGADSTASHPVADKAGLEMTGSSSGSPSGSLGAKEGLELGDKAATTAAGAGGVQGLVARAVAEQTSSVREEAALAGHVHSQRLGAGPGPGSVGAQGCVPECSAEARQSHASPSSAPDFSSLGQPAVAAAARPGAHDGTVGSPPWPAGPLDHGHDPGAAGAASGSGPAGTGLRSGSRTASGTGAAPAGGGFDAALPGGRHLGGHAVGSPGASPSGMGPGPGPASPLSGPRPGSLPPLRLASKLPAIPKQASAQRSLLFPAQKREQNPKAEGGATGRELPAE